MVDVVAQAVDDREIGIDHRVHDRIQQDVDAHREDLVDVVVVGCEGVEGSPGRRVRREQEPLAEDEVDLRGRQLAIVGDREQDDVDPVIPTS